MIPLGTKFKIKDKSGKIISPEIFVVTGFDELDNGAMIKSLSTGCSLYCRPLRNNEIEILTNNKENMERNLRLTIEQAQKLYSEQSSMRELLLTTFSKEELEGVVLKDWVQLPEIEGCYIGSDSQIYSNSHNRISSRNVFATAKQVKSALAMAQLSQLMKDLGGECEVDWGDNQKGKFCIIRHGNVLTACFSTSSYSFLAFKTPQFRNAFMKKHERLIKDYFMLD